MEAVELLNHLGTCGVSVSVDREELVLRPASKIPPDLLDEVRHHKDAIVQKLGQRYGDGELPTLDRPHEAEQELRRWMDYAADPKRFAERFDWAVTTFDPSEYPQESL